MRTMLLLLLTVFLQAQDAFLVKPYLQLGDAPRVAAKERLDLLWHAEDRDVAWTIEVKGTRGWIPQATPTLRRLDAPPLPTHRIYRVTLRGLTPGARVPYRVKLNGAVVFEAGAQARKPGAHRMIVFGDAADGSKEQAAIAQAVAAQKPDAVFITGDLVYPRGRASEYRAVFFPAYNSDEVPLLRSVPFLGVPGNHDVPWDLQRWPDTLAYFAYWSLPLNGPALRRGESNAAPAVAGYMMPWWRLRARPSPAWPATASTTARSTGRCWIPTSTPTGQAWP